MRFFLSVLTVLISVATHRASDNWPAFRGPTANGHADARDLPTQWSETENIRWKTPIHDKGWSSPVIWGNQIWLTTAREDGKELFALCIDRESGRVVHNVKVFEVEKPAFCHPFNSYASSTPVIEDGRIYIHFGSNGTACLDTSNAKVLWERRDFKCDHFRGAGSSPILFGKLLILTFDGFDVQYVVALDKETGKTVWKRDKAINFPSTNGDLRKAYSTPVVITVEGKPQLISPSAEATIALDPATGEEVWRIIHGGMNESSRPLYVNGLLYLTSGHTTELLAVRPQGRGTLTKQHIEWKSSKAAPSRGSLLLIEDLVYMINDGGIASCLEAKTGERVWQERLGGNFSSSPIYASGHIYGSDQEGNTYVIDPGRQFKRVATNRLADGCMASPAVAGKAIYLRTKTNLYRIERP